MRLGIPPTLRQSSLLIDSHSLTVTQSPLPRGGNSSKLISYRHDKEIIKNI